jgi:hypothetical protein
MAFRPKWARKTAQTPARRHSSPPMICGLASAPPPLATDAKISGRWSPFSGSPKVDSSPFDMSPPALPHHSSVFPVSDPSAVKHLLTPLIPHRNSTSSPVLNKTPSNRDDPRTWPIPPSTIPHDTRQQLANTHGRDADACTLQRHWCKVLHELLSTALKDMDNEDEKEMGEEKMTAKQREEKRRGRRSLAFFC